VIWSKKSPTNQPKQTQFLTPPFSPKFAVRFEQGRFTASSYKGGLTGPLPFCVILCASFLREPRQSSNLFFVRIERDPSPPCRSSSLRFLFSPYLTVPSPLLGKQFLCVNNSLYFRTCQPPVSMHFSLFNYVPFPPLGSLTSPLILTFFLFRLLCFFQVVNSPPFSFFFDDLLLIASPHPYAMSFSLSTLNLMGPLSKHPDFFPPPFSFLPPFKLTPFSPHYF